MGCRTMTSAELRSIREGLGLSVVWCALHVGDGVSSRAWNYWEGGRAGIVVRVPNAVAAKMRVLAKSVARAVPTY